MRAVGDGGGRLPRPWLTQAIARALRGPVATSLPPPLVHAGDGEGDTELGKGATPESPGDPQAQGAGQDEAHSAGCRKALTRCPSQHVS